ncbi:hypothetical protein K440DRAFT_630872, partial [Wilcoxina mikolae CBS 423.85]
MFLAENGNYYRHLIRKKRRRKGVRGLGGGCVVCVCVFGGTRIETTLCAPGKVEGGRGERSL